MLQAVPIDLNYIGHAVVSHLTSPANERYRRYTLCDAQNGESLLTSTVVIGLAVLCSDGLMPV